MFVFSQSERYSTYEFNNMLQIQNEVPVVIRIYLVSKTLCLPPLRGHLEFFLHSRRGAFRRCPQVLLEGHSDPVSGASISKAGDLKNSKKRKFTKHGIFHIYSL